MEFEEKSKRTPLTVSITILYLLLNLATLVLGFLYLFVKSARTEGLACVALILGLFCVLLCVSICFFFTIRRRKIDAGVWDKFLFAGKAKAQSEQNLKEAKAKAEFVTNMSHEIRTPMNAICCATELLMKEELPLQAQSYVGILKSSSANLLDIVNDILDYSKMDAGKMTLSEAEYEVKTLISDIRNIIAVRLADKDVAFTIDIDPTLPCKLVGDETRIRQILINLLGNAVKYTTKGEINLSISYERLSKETIDVTFTVSDTGCGIPPSDKANLFNKFEQANKLGNRHLEGTGLGLAICRQLTELMGGSITFDSELGKGSVFRACVRQKVVDAAPLVAEDGKPRYAMDFLVWEENNYYSESFVRVLKNLNISVKKAETASDAEGVLSSVKIDYLIASDSFFTEALELAGKFSPTTVIVKTVLPGSSYEAPEDNSFAVFHKPVDMFEILKLFEKGSNRKVEESAFAGKLTAPEARVLVVDDNRVNLKVAKALFETFESKIVAVDSGFEAIDLVKMGEKFDLIFMDHMMPGMDGIEASKRIWELEGEKKTPIIALTANAGGEVENLFFEAGLSDFIPKPIVMKNLTYIMEKWIPKEKQIYSAAEGVAPKKEAPKTGRTFEPLIGMGKFWDDEKIYGDILELFVSRSEEIINSISAIHTPATCIDRLEELGNLAESVGALTLTEMLNEAMNIARVGDQELFAEKVSRLKDEIKLVNGRISKYLADSRPEDVLTIG